MVPAISGVKKIAKRYQKNMFWWSRGPGPGPGRALARPGPGPRARPRPGPGRAPARPKKSQKMRLFFCKAQQKRKSGQKIVSLLVKRSKKRKSSQKSASLLVKRSKNAKMTKNCRAGPCHAGRAVPDNPVPSVPCRAAATLIQPCEANLRKVRPDGKGP